MGTRSRPLGILWQSAGGTATNPLMACFGPFPNDAWLESVFIRCSPALGGAETFYLEAGFLARRTLDVSQMQGNFVGGGICGTVDATGQTFSSRAALLSVIAGESLQLELPVGAFCSDPYFGFTLTSNGDDVYGLAAARIRFFSD